MDERQQQIKSGAGLEESRINEDFKDFLEKWGFWLLLAVGVLWLLRRVSGGNLRRGGLLQVRDSVAVGQRERVVVVSAGGRDYVLGVAPGNVRHLDTVIGGLSVADAASPQPVPAAPSFMAILERSLGRSK